jgi:hypothetical protein
MEEAKTRKWVVKASRIIIIIIIIILAPEAEGGSGSQDFHISGT